MSHDVPPPHPSRTTAFGAPPLVVGIVPGQSASLREPVVPLPVGHRSKSVRR